MLISRIHTILLALLGLSLSLSCATIEKDRVKPISNPFYSYHPGPKGESPPLVLRSKKGDRSVEIEIPGDTENLSDFVVPVSPAFKDTGNRSPSSVSTDQNSSPVSEESFSNHPATSADHEITRSFSQGSPEDEEKRRSIEQGLNLVQNEDETPTEGSQSYLASMDHIKQLYRNNRYEAALLETDDMVKQFQTDPKLYEMRGTLLERLGKESLLLNHGTRH